MKISARNTIKGKVQAIVLGAVNAEVTLQLPDGQEIVAIITKDSANRLGLKQGQQAYALIKASDVMIGVDS